MTISVCLLPVSPLPLPSGSLFIFDKLGHENKPSRCQENAKYGASFLWLCLFNQLPLISALHPLFLSFQNVMEEKSVHCQRLRLSTLLLLLRPRSRSSLSLSLSISVILLATLLILCRAVSFSVSSPHSSRALFLSPCAYLPPTSLPFFFFLLLCLVPLFLFHFKLSCCPYPE